MLAVMQHEPFYKSGLFSAPELGIYAGWVAHENSFAANQVFFNEGHDIVILLSGECFADPGIIRELRRKGHRFDDTDGAWLPHLYEEKESRFWESLNGLFSGLLIDKRKKNLYLFNDRYGMERIYWHETKDGFYFASEAKALLSVLPQLREFDPDGVAQFLSFGCTLGSRTLFRGIETLPPGSRWWFDSNKVHKERYFSPENWESQEPLSAESFEEQFAITFRNLLQRHLRASSKLGISLTAGLDSRMIMAGFEKTTPAPVCYTFAGEERDPLDASIAARVAVACGLEHHILRLDKNFFAEFPAQADRTVYVTDGTVGVFGAHEIYFNAKARQLAPVRLTGVFGGEIMRGVSFFKPLRLSSKLFSPEFRRRVAAVEQEQFALPRHPITFAAFNETPQRRFGPPAAARSQLPFRTPYLDNDFVALCYRAPRTTGNVSDPGLQFVSKSNPVLASIPTDRGYVDGERTLLAKAFAETLFKLDYFYTEGLPRRATRLDALFRRTTSLLGISGRYKFLHYRAWSQRKLAGYVDERLASVRRGIPFWEASSLKAIFDDHKSGRANYVHEINSVLTLEAVERLMLKGSWTGEDPAKAAS